MQNRMYTRLYDCIDLAWYDAERAEAVDVVDLLSRLFAEILSKFTLHEPRHDGVPRFALPIALPDGVDLALKNYHTYVYHAVVKL